MRKDLATMGAATDLGQGKAGTELAPSWLRLKGTHEILNRKFFSTEDLGDITPLKNGNDLRAEKADRATLHKQISLYNKRLADIAKDALAKNKTLLTFGGDHSIAIGTLAGSLFHNPDTKVVWVDAHADINTPKTSPSGNVHGMPLAFFLNLVKDEAMNKAFSWVPHLKKENLVYIGLRDVDPGERKFIKELGITSFYAEDVLDLGINKTLEMTLNQLAPKGEADLHLSFDVDGLDPLYVPATGTPVPGGLSLLDGQMIINTLMRETNLISFDLVEVNPMLGTTEKELDITSHSVSELLESIPSWDKLGANLQELQLLRNERLSPEV